MAQNKFPKEIVVLIEQFDSKMDLVLESVTESRRDMIERMNKRSEQHDARFDIIEGVLRQHSIYFSKIEQRLDHLASQVKRHDNVYHSRKAR